MMSRLPVKLDPRAATAADEIVLYIRKDRLRKLPPMRAMARMLGLSHAVTLSALRLLRDRKVIEYSRGSAIRVIDESGPPAAVRKNAVERVAGRIVSRIEEGHYPIGRQLPKVGFLAGREGVNQATVCRAYRLLHDQGLIHRHGRGYVAGPRDSLSLTQEHSRRDSALIMLHLSESSLHPVLEFPWTSDFLRALMREMAFLQVRPVMVTLRPDSGANPYGSVSGLEALMLTAQGLGKALVGIVVMFDYWEAQAENADVLDLLGKLCAAGMKVVWLDKFDSCRSPPDGELVAVYNRFVKRRAVSRNLVRCHMDVRRSLRVTLSALSDAGHRVIGVPNPGGSPSWLRSRSEFLVQEARATGSGLNVVLQKDCEPLFKVRGTATGQELAAHMDTGRFPFLSYSRSIAMQPRNARTPFAKMSHDVQSLLSATARLGALIARHNPTALIAPNDRRARICYRWLLAAGIQIPREMSLISFDDDLDRLYPYPISSVNFGFDYLGYACFHALLGDRAVRKDRRNSIGALPRINHTGTIGPVPGR